MCSKGGIVVAPDYRHILKRVRNAHVSTTRETQIGDMRLTAATTRQWLLANKVEGTQSMMNAADKQNVSAAMRFLRAVAEADPDMQLVRGRENTFGPYLRVLGALFKRMLSPMSADVGLSDQMRDLSCIAHVVCFLFWLHGREAMPTQLYHDLHSFCKAAYVLTARAQVRDRSFKLYLCQVGEDQNEEFNSILRRSHDTNFSTCDLQVRATIATQLYDIQSRHPDWRPQDRCSRSQPEIPGAARLPW
eukprot:GHVU01140925.1.p1 GENE.GHVU01140925.1~~GHVU01140925.1.p1  ORF type:complete len:247 (+),score=26.32 GHVU01140925.1:155-895(+)